MLKLTLLQGNVIDYEPHIGFAAYGMREKGRILDSRMGCGIVQN